MFFDDHFPQYFIHFIPYKLGLNDRLYDYEKFEKEWESTEPDAEQWKLPKDDVRIERVPNQDRYAIDIIPPILKKAKSRNVKPYLVEITKCFSADSVFVQRKFVNSIPLLDQNRQDEINSKLAPLEFAALERGKAQLSDNSEGSHINKNLVARPDPVNDSILHETTSRNFHQRNEHRVPLFQIFSGAQKYLPTQPADEIFPSYKPADALEFMVDPGDLFFEYGNFEPFLCSLSLYHIVKKKKLSETFYFHVNDKARVAMLHDPQCLPEHGRAIFKLTHSSPDVFLLLRIEKILQGELDVIIDPYMKGDSVKDKDKEKSIAAATQFAGKYSYWQPFAWSIVPLLNDEGNIPDLITFKPINRVKDTDLTDVNLFASSEKGSTKKQKSIPGSCTIRVKKIPKQDVIAGRLSPSLYPVLPTNDKVRFREIQEFPFSPILVPHLEYRNDMYIYIESANLSGRTGSPSAKNIAISVKLLDRDTDINAPGLEVFYGRGRNEKTTSATTHVTFHNKMPQYYNEFKIALPPNLHSDYHLVFTFYHVNTQATPGKSVKGLPQSNEIVVGYAIWKIFPNDRVVSSDVIPIFSDVTATEYLSDESGYKAIDNKKPLLKLKAKLISTIYTQDIHLNNMFKRMKPFSASLAPSVYKTIECILKVHPIRIIQNLPVILNHFFGALCIATEDTLSKCFIVLPEILFGIGNTAAAQAKSILRSYSDAVFDFCRPKTKDLPNCRCVHEVMCEQWLLCIRDSDLDCEALLKHSSFMFKIIYKSMVFKIEETGEIKDPGTRVSRYSVEYTNSLRGLVAVLTWEIQQRRNSSLTLCKDLCRSLAGFLNDLLSIMDRSIVLKMIEKFITDITKSDETDLTLMDFKFEFLRILLEYEHFLALNMPRGYTSVPKTSKIIPFFKERHYLASVIVEDIGSYLIQDDRSVRIKAMDVIRRAFIGHDYDTRLTDHKVKDKALSIYFPLLTVIVDHPIDIDAVFEEHRDFLICFLYLLKHTDPNILHKWIVRENLARVKRFFDVIFFCIKTFEFVGKERWLEKMTESSEVKSSAMTKASIESFYSSGGVPKRTTYRQQRAEQQEAQSQTGESSQRAFKRTLKRKATPGSKGVSVDDLYNEAIEANLSNEASFVILNVVEGYLNQLEPDSCNPQIFEKVLLFFVMIMKTKQSIEFLDYFFTSLRGFIERFGKQLFADTAFLGDFCFQIMGHCNCRNITLRCQASALLFLLMRKYYACHPDYFQRITVQITIALSKLVGLGLSSDIYLKNALASINKYASLDKQASAQFRVSVEGLSERLFAVLRDNMKIAMSASDAEMTADLYHRLAQGYTNAPSLRMTWLESLGTIHSKMQRHAESAMCSIHIAAMIAEYLHVTTPQVGRPQGCQTFALVSPNLLEETSVRESSAVVEKDSPESSIFTEMKMVGYMQHAVAELKAGDLFETAGELYKLIIPVYEKNLGYDQMALAYGELQSLYSSVVDCVASERRMLGSYYRVGFYGNPFEELHGCEFVYKEPKITKLVEIKERLKNMYQTKLNTEVQIIVTSNDVEVATLDLSVAHIQITSVDPFIDAEEAATTKRTHYWKNNNINRFIFVTPFIKPEKRGSESVADQFIRRTILTTEQYFPYMRLRLAVAKKEHIVLDPLAHAIAEVRKQSARILSECSSTNPSLKTLQPVLSGSVCLQVQAGPLEYSRVFFVDRYSEWPAEQLKELREELLKFLDACSVGLEKHETMCESENDAAFHASLITGLDKTVVSMDQHWQEYFTKALA